jgi:hypothetical protein
MGKDKIINIATVIIVPGPMHPKPISTPNLPPAGCNRKPMAFKKTERSNRQDGSRGIKGRPKK